MRSKLFFVILVLFLSNIFMANKKNVFSSHFRSILKNIYSWISSSFRFAPPLGAWGLLLLWGLGGFFLSCSPTDSLTSKAYHNLTAHYNGYFLARNRMDSVENVIFMTRKEDYNRVLEVMPFPEDTAQLKTYDNRMQDIIKKSAIVHNRHDNSKFLFPSYTLIGKARFFLRKYEEGINTLKYVNTKAKEQQDKNRALIELFRIYVEIKDEKSADYALNTLHKRSLDDDNKRDFYLVRANYFRKKNDYLETAKTLGSAVQLMRRGEKRGRIYFILGQLYQKLEKNNLAYKNYQEVLRNNPPYELAFYAKLYSTQVTEINTEKDLKKMERYFKKLLSDENNEEYKDKIYYEMALFALKQNNLPLCIQHLKTSLAQVGGSSAQKGYTFLKLGELHYKPLAKYEKSKTYYDSTVAYMSKSAENFKAIEKRQRTLTEFVKQLNIYRLQDSLQRLARMPETDRLAYLDKMLYQEEFAKQRELDSLQKIAEKKALEDERKKKEKGTLAENITGKDAGWYFANPNAMLLGQQNFIKKWGNRPLEDNWRRTNKPVNTNDTTTKKIENTEITRLSAEVLREQSIKKRVEQRKNAVLNIIPKTPSDFASSEKKTEDALYELGKIYRLKLQEPQNSIDYFGKLLQLFPATKYEPEALYSMYLCAKDLQNTEEMNKYKDLLVLKYPNSSFARLITNPNYLKEVKASDKEVKAMYEDAFKQFKITNYAKAQTILLQIQAKHPQNLVEDKILMLQIILAQKIENYKDNQALKTRLEDFAKKYPESPITATIKDIIPKIKIKK